MFASKQYIVIFAEGKKQNKTVRSGFLFHWENLASFMYSWDVKVCCPKVYAVSFCNN